MREAIKETWAGFILFFQDSGYRTYIKERFKEGVSIAIWLPVFLFILCLIAYAIENIWSLPPLD